MLERKIRADFSKKCGRIKPLNGICLGPLFDTPIPSDFGEEYLEMGAPVVRTSVADIPKGCRPSVDVSRIFPDPNLDERFPESYDFTELDKELSSIRKCGATIFLALGEHRDEYSRTAARPHVETQKWARIAEKIILRYQKGWGGGPKLPIKMLEIWPGADLPGAFLGGAEAYAQFYHTVATHLKRVFPTLKIGAYSSGGFASLNRYGATDEERGYIGFLESFLSFVSEKETAAPLDFFTWRCRADSAEELALHASYAKNFLAQYGLRKTVSIVSELILEPQDGAPALSRSYPSLLAATLAVASGTDISMMLYSSLYPYSPDNALITLDDCRTKHRYSAFGVMRAYGELLRHASAVEVTENFRRELYMLASASDKGAALMIATAGYSGMLSVELVGAPFRYYSIRGMLGGGPRGEGFSTEECDIPLGEGRFNMKVGQGEVYLISLY